MNHEPPQLTICSVYHSDMSKRLLEMNEELIRRLNPDVSWVRFVVNNSPQGSLHISDPAIKEFPGTTPPPPGFEGNHYGAALNSLTPHIRTRFALILDYDFFILRPHWIREVLQYMQERNLGMLGASYRPKYWVKFRHFPVQFCLFVDREKIGEEFTSWDFRPQNSSEKIHHMNVSEIKKRAYKARYPNPSWVRRLWENIKKRRYIGTSEDMCYDIYRRYYGKNLVRYECFGSTAELNDFLSHYYVHPRWYPLLYWLERLIPERWSFVPRGKDYVTFQRFKDVGLYDAFGTGMEEWWWQRKPFAFHLRGFKERHLKSLGKVFDPEENVKIIREITDSFPS